MNHNPGEGATPTTQLSSMQCDIRGTNTKLLSIVVLSLLVVTSLSGPVAAHTGDNGVHHHDGWMGSHDGWGGWMDSGLGFIWMLLWSVVLIGIPLGLVYLLITRRTSTAGPTDDDALALLRQRYAQGKIDEDEFDTRRTKLQTEQD